MFQYKKAQKCHIWELNPSFLFDLHQGMVTNENKYVTKMALCATMGGLWGDFTAIFWIAKWLQKSIYIWNKISKHITSQCGMNFSIYSLTYNLQLSTFWAKWIC